MESKEQKCSLWPIGTSVTIKKLMENARKIGETFFWNGLHCSMFEKFEFIFGVFNA